MIAVALCAVLVSGAYVSLGGISEPLTSDAHYFKQLAQSLSKGEGYRVADSYWPDDPSCRRLPGWPGLSALAFIASPFNDDLTMRVLGVLLVGVAAVGFYRVGVDLMSPVCGWACSAVYMFHPGTLHYAREGLSEGLFVACAVWGVNSVLRDRRIIGAQLWGAALLVRANFLPFGLVMIACHWFIRRGSLRDLSFRAMTPVLLMLMLYVAPLGAWSLRNWAVTGSPGVISTLRGQTYYGGNNSVVASDSEMKGYWVFPDEIPDETPMRELAVGRSELDVDRYYVSRADQFIKENMGAMPSLVATKVTRAFLPIGGEGVIRQIFNLYRWGLLVAGLIGLIRYGKEHPMMVSIVAAAFATCLTTVGVFWGSIRLAYPAEVLLIPFTGLMVAQTGGLLAGKFRKTPEEDAAVSSAGGDA